MRVSRDISGYFNTDFWNSHVLQASETESAVRHAVVALSSLYEAYETSQLSQGSSNDQHEYFMRLAIRQYNKAISALSNRINTGDPVLEVILMVWACLCASQSSNHQHYGPHTESRGKRARTVMI
jgi:hypothetical protein